MKKIQWSLVGLAFSGLAYGATVSSIEFENTGGNSEIRILADGPVTFDKQVNAADKQVILELKGAKLAASAARKLDTSSFDGKVSLVSPYQVEGTEDTARVVIQMRDMADANVTQDGNNIKVSVPMGATQAAAPPPTDAAAPPPPPTSDSAPPPADTPVPSAAAANPPAGPVADTLADFEKNQATKRFTGRKVTMIVKDADLSDVFQLIGEASGFNVMISSDVKGKVTLDMVSVPWDQALEMILHTQQLGAERNGNVLRITTLQALTAEKQAELQAKQASDANAPRVTRVFSINYANLSDLVAMLSKFGATASPNSPAQGSTASIVQADNRTNSIVVRDTGENIERMRKLIEILDTQTPQVLIEAKIIEATESFSRNIGGSLGVGMDGINNAGLPPLQAFTTANGGNPLDVFISTTGAPAVFSGGSAISGNSAGGGQFGASFTFLPGLQINALLNLAENESKIRVISSPKTVVMNKQAASIVQGTPVLVPGTTFVAGVGTVPTTTVQTANVSLDVTPTVTNEGSVLMQVTLSKDSPFSLSGGNTAVANRKMSTQVLVESGTTLVIGGIYTMSQTNTESGFPFLHKIPILGWLFGNKSSETDRSELFMFITPRILNPKEAGLAG